MTYLIQGSLAGAVAIEPAHIAELSGPVGGRKAYAHCLRFLKETGGGAVGLDKEPPCGDEADEQAVALGRLQPSGVDGQGVDGVHCGTLFRLELHLLVRDDGAWEPWLLYVLRAISQTSQQTLELIEGMRALMADYKQRLRAHPSIRYSQDLLNNLFRHPYTRIEFLQADLGVTRQTAAKYLDLLAEAGFVEKHQQGRNNYYVNTPLIELFMRVSEGG